VAPLELEGAGVSVEERALPALSVAPVGVGARSGIAVDPVEESARRSTAIVGSTVPSATGAGGRRQPDVCWPIARSASCSAVTNSRGVW
jgi:hypothetical protein